MNWLFTTLVVLIIIASILLVIVVLLQNGKGGGLASNFVAGNQAFGVRQTADILEKVTWGLVAFVLVAAIVTSFTLGGTRGTGIDVTERIEEQATEQPAFPTLPSQAAPAQEEPSSEAPAGEASPSTEAS